jgi:hypothetical protein
MCWASPQHPHHPFPAAFAQNADSVEEDHLVFDLQPSSPRLRAELQESEQQAALNRQLAQQIPQLDAWPQLQEFVQHGAHLNFLNVVALVTRAAALQQQVCAEGFVLTVVAPCPLEFALTPAPLLTAQPRDCALVCACDTPGV